MVKLLMTWDVRPGKEEPHIEFVAKTFIPRMVRLDMRLIDIWSTLYGDVPQISIGWATEDRPTALRMLNSREWRSLHEQLHEFVTDFRFKIAPLDTVV